MVPLPRICPLISALLYNNIRWPSKSATFEQNSALWCVRLAFECFGAPRTFVSLPGELRTVKAVETVAGLEGGKDREAHRWLRAEQLLKSPYSAGSTKKSNYSSGSYLACTDVSAHSYVSTWNKLKCSHAVHAQAGRVSGGPRPAPQAPPRR